MSAEHNHPPLCCCDDGPELGGTGPCPACPEHGELAAPYTEQETTK
jgi:hypothetical protein